MFSNIIIFILEYTRQNGWSYQKGIGWSLSGTQVSLEWIFISCYCIFFTIYNKIEMERYFWESFLTNLTCLEWQCISESINSYFSWFKWQIVLEHKKEKKYFSLKIFIPLLVLEQKRTYRCHEVKFGSQNQIFKNMLLFSGEKS